MPMLRAYDWHSVELSEADIFVGALGFESRCIHAAEMFGRLCQTRLAFQFEDRNVLSYAKNKAWLEAADFNILPSDTVSLRSGLDIAIAEYADRDNIRMIVDISSMSRPMLADVVSYLSRTAKVPLLVQFLYSPAKFTAPPTGISPQTYSGPVTPDYAGWTLDPALPLAAVIGVGYEFGRALGILEYVEPAVAWLFTPRGFDSGYDAASSRVNSDLFGMVPKEQQVQYDVRATMECFERLEALVYGVKERGRVLLCPFGPKMFALICLLVAELHAPDATVWRVSGGQSEEPTDHEASGEICRLPIQFRGLAT